MEVTAVKLRKLLLAAGVSAALFTGAGTQAVQAVQAAPAHPSGGAPPIIEVQSCTGGSFCLATGHRPGDRNAPFIEEWNGQAWGIIPNPSGYDGSITCGGPSFCLALTSQPKKAARYVLWPGKAWRKFSPQPPDQGIECLSPTFCAAADQDFNSDGVSWNGKTWQTMAGGTGCGGAWCHVDNFGCASATNCWSSGDYCGDSDCDDGTFFWNDIWNGTSWVQGVSMAGVGDDEACTGRSFCLSLDPPKATTTTDWFTTTHDASAGLATACHHLASCALPTRPACGSPRFCLALPSQDPSASLAWNGTKWRVVRLALISGHLPKLTDLACGSPANCMASGSYQLTPRSTPRPITEHWNGKNWTITPLAKT
jgi:hypothetical protein